MRRVATIGAISLVSACAPLRMQPAPKIVSVTPESVAVLRGPITEVVLQGKGFEAGASGRNTVEIGPVVLTGIPANADGTEIRFVVPAEYASGGEAPPRRVMPGAYAVTVRTRAGVSNAVVVRIIE